MNENANPAEAASTPLLRLVVCGSVDDGKSTLIGRLLVDCGQVPADVLAAVSPGDLAALLDGLESEREQGITIDVATRSLTTPRARFLISDAPGHEQYTRNMVTAGSLADAALILVDARKGVLTQTRRHAFIAGLLGVRQILVAVTKMDLADEEAFDRVVDEFGRFADAIGLAQPVRAIPVSGLDGDNVVTRSARFAWYRGPTLLGALESLEGDAEAAGSRAFRMPVQLVNRVAPDFRGYAGTIASGAVAPGDEVRILASGRTTRIERIVTADGDRDVAVAGQAVTLTLADHVDCARGDVIARADDPPAVADRFECSLVWLGDEPMVAGRGYALKLATQTVRATVQAPKYEIAVDTLEHLAAKTLTLNAIGVAEVATDRPIVFAPYAEDRMLGGFILIDRESHATVAAGMIHFALRRATNIHPQATTVGRDQRARLMDQRPMVLWLTGLSGAGKSTIANLVEQKLHRLGRHSFLLDGDNVRHGLNKDLGFTEADRIENIRRVGEVARLMTDSGLVVIAAFISPFAAEREMVRAMMAPGEFLEIFVDTPIAEAEKRDVKGLYAKARTGALRNFTGIDSPYEAPDEPDLRLDTMRMSADEAADAVVAAYLDKSRP